MIRLSVEKVTELHKMMTSQTGGNDALRDRGLLESALANAFSGFGDVEFYPTVEEKAARLGYELISNHAFADGNKRIGVFVMLIFLRINGIGIVADNEDIIKIGLGVASGEMGYEMLLEWVNAHKE